MKQILMHMRHNNNDDDSAVCLLIQYVYLIFTLKIYIYAWSIYVNVRNNSNKKCDVMCQDIKWLLDAFYFMIAIIIIHYIILK